MVLAAILAGGTGTRFGSAGMPKQYLALGSKPILVHTVEKFLVHPRVEHVVVLTPRAWLSHTESILAAALPGETKISVVEGGQSRNDTLRRALDFITAHFGGDEDHVLLTHDAVRPFVTHRIISDNIQAAAEFGACDTVIPATDTIVESADGAFIRTIPERQHMFQGQTPQSFRVGKLRTLMASLRPEEESLLTDACKIFTLRGEPVALVSGENHNIKITYPYDLQVAQTLLGQALEESH
ncbi:MAG: 2-C-methyl-D-erythritol 4-phosphate cytidylyltransferase [Oscillospiraceae bacterium]|jgi:2-C-methyl-D-erythritol 4-phosphate cytidylyltransferase|nr:2-C-methyl-D-erythritol 4-phosphate cytidylyltransferase [Oscillospiraceae bacterium]